MKGKKIQEEALVTSIVKKTAGKNKDYSQYSKENLIDELNKLKKQKKFGLVWEDKTEDVVEQCKREAPILKQIKEKTIKTDKDSPNNILIEGDNYHALQVLNYTHKGKIDVIYIDPPYNTGNRDWKYNDEIVDSADEYKHSKWLSMMDKRLRLSKNLLSKKGVIFISIDDNEQANLKLLCDDIFGEDNFVNNLIWQRASGGGNAGDIVTGHDYVLVYKKSFKHKFFGEKTKRGKTIKYKGKEITINDDVVRKVFGKYKRGTERRCYYEELKIYKNKKAIDEINKKIDGGEYILLKQDNKKHFIAEVIDKKENKRQILYSIIQGVLNNDGNNEILELKLNFNNPKPKNLIKLLVNSINLKEVAVLDFFAGSGTTGHAVLELNKEDGGNRKFILCTNNENKIAEEVTYPRIKKVIEGYKKNGNGEKIDGLGGNLEYLKTEFVNVDNINQVSDKKKLEFIHEAGEMIALKEDCFQEVIKNKHYQVFTDGKNKYVGIYFRENTEKLIELEGRVLDKDEVRLYIFSYSGGSEWRNEYEEYENVVVEDIPESILKVYKKLNINSNL